jgi:hypothetical protein
MRFAQCSLDARLAEDLADFRKNLEDEIAAIVVRVLDEYKHELRKEYLDARLDPHCSQMAQVMAPVR